MVTKSWENQKITKSLLNHIMEQQSDAYKIM